jgi:hydrogenase maturation protease
MPSGVEVIDGGTWGMRLLPAIEDAESLLLIDAIDVGMPPGTEVTLPREEIPRTFALKLSPHQIDLAEVLAICEVRGRLPERTVAIGLQPELVQWGSPISASVERRIDALVATAVYQLSLWGHDCTPREVARA